MVSVPTVALHTERVDGDDVASMLDELHQGVAYIVIVWPVEIVLLACASTRAHTCVSRLVQQVARCLCTTVRTVPVLEVLVVLLVLLVILVPVVWLVLLVAVAVVVAAVVLLGAAVGTDRCLGGSLYARLVASLAVLSELKDQSIQVDLGLWLSC